MLHHFSKEFSLQFAYDIRSERNLILLFYLESFIILFKKCNYIQGIYTRLTVQTKNVYMDFVAAVMEAIGWRNSWSGIFRSSD